ncbi:hypothetical protein DKX38_026550 [Salix brachista]|uniref:Uncharacterized protein n=1 Tax=Salix brachista TaxID=2182728 RepID=A0A5N5JAT9_9ROSI|nr:hypothetical protein DKX38_026550 [Salix brachista]
MVFMSCKNTVDSRYRPVNYSNSSLMTHSNYVTDGGMTASDLMELCSIEKIFLLPKKNYTDKSFEEIHNDLAYGFELSWYNFYCGKCKSDCYLNTTTDRRQCFDYDESFWQSLLYSRVGGGASSLSASHLFCGVLKFYLFPILLYTSASYGKRFLYFFSFARNF